MIYILILAAALLPAILLFVYIWKKDAQPEPTSQLVKAFLWGVAIILPIVIVEFLILFTLFGNSEPTSVLGTTAMAFFGAALPEEAFKLLALWLFLRKNPYFDEHFDGIVYAVCIGLGFAGIENIFYVFGTGEWVTTAISRALLAVPGHYAFAVIMGYYYSVYHFIDHSQKTLFLAFLIPFLAHGIYDAIALSNLTNPYLGAISTIVLIIFCIKMHHTANKKLVAMVEKDRNTTNMA